MLSLKNILVATDFSESSVAALAYGRALARVFGARLHVLHVVDPFTVDTTAFGIFAPAAAAEETQLEAAARKRLDDIVTDDDRRNLRVVVALRTVDAPAHAIVGYSVEEQIDLIVVGTHGRKGISHVLMGSVAETVVRLAPCSVLTVRHPEREFLIPDQDGLSNASRL